MGACRVDRQSTWPWKWFRIRCAWNGRQSSYIHRDLVKNHPNCRSLTYGSLWYVSSCQGIGCLLAGWLQQPRRRDRRRATERPKSLPIFFWGLFETSDTTAMLGVWDTMIWLVIQAPTQRAQNSLMKGYTSNYIRILNMIYLDAIGPLWGRVGKPIRN